MLPSVPEIPYAFAPRPIAAGFQIAAHDRFDLIRRDIVLISNLPKADMVGKRHFDDFAQLRRGQVIGDARHPWAFAPFAV